MIFTFFIDAFFTVISGIVSLLPRIEPTGLFQSQVLEDFTDLIFNNLGLLDIIAPLNYVLLVFGMVVTLLISKFVFDLVMFVLKKVPFASIK